MTSNINDTIKRLKECIIQSGYSYEQLEIRTGISRSSLQRYANGITSKIPIDAIQNIAGALGVRAEYILGWDDPASPNNETITNLLRAEYHMNEDDIRFLTDYMKLSSAEREAFRAAIDTIKKIKGADQRPES